MKKAIITILAMALFSVMSVGNAFALLVGQIGFTGAWTHNTPSVDFGGLGSILISSPSGLISDGEATLDFDTADNQQAFYTVPANLIYSPATLPTQTPYWWTITGSGGDLFQFTLTSFSILFRNDEVLNLVGQGTIFRNGIDATPADWWFNATPTNYSSSAIATTIPEPATMILIGTGLVGLVGTRIRRRKK